MSSFKLKVLLTGAAAVGKTSLVQRFIKNRFQANYKLTVGVDILTKDVEFRSGEIATLSIWDIGGQQRFEFIRSTFYKGAAGALLENEGSIYIETSAKTGVNVDEAFTELTRRIIDSRTL